MAARQDDALNRNPKFPMARRFANHCGCTALALLIATAVAGAAAQAQTQTVPIPKPAPKGRDMLIQAVEAAGKEETALLSALTDTQRRQLNGLLRTLMLSIEGPDAED